MQEIPLEQIENLRFDLNYSELKESMECAILDIEIKTLWIFILLSVTVMIIAITDPVSPLIVYMICFAVIYWVGMRIIQQKHAKIIDTTIRNYFQMEES